MDDREFGFYIRLLNHSWLNNGVPSDLKRLAVIMGRTFGYVTKIWPSISPCFFERDGRFFNKKQENSREKSKEFSEIKSEAATVRWDKYKKLKEQSDARASAVQCSPSASPTAIEEEPPKPPAPTALVLTSPSSNGHARKNGHRTTEQIRKALGEERGKWWDAFWDVFPGRDGKQAGMDTFERKVHTHELAVKVFKGAKRYSKQCAADSTIKIKFAQGWLNDERYEDENRMPELIPRKNGRATIDELADSIEAFGRTR